MISSTNSEIYSYNTRSSQNLETILCRTDFYYKSFLPSPIRDWNNISVSVRNGSLNLYKSFLNKKLQILNTFIQVVA